MRPRYPQIHVSVASRNTLALVAAVRHAMRMAHLDRSEIRRFSNEALADAPAPARRKVCERWVDISNAHSASP